MGELAKTLVNFELVAIDTNIFIYYLQKEEFPAYHTVLAAIFHALEKGDFQGVSSVLMLTELLTLPQKLGEEHVAQHYYLLLKNFPNLKLLPVTEKVALRAAGIRGKWGLKTPDALHIATAIEAGAKAFLTNDRSIGKGFPGLQIIYLSDFLPSHN
jgi:predicted nucleic acid-binding protein